MLNRLPRPQARNFISRCCFSLLFLFFAFSLAAEPIGVYFAPDGGFAPENFRRFEKSVTGKNRKQTITAPVHQLLESWPSGGVIRVVMYNFDDRAILSRLLEGVENKNWRVDFIFDNVAAWTEPIVAANVQKIAEFADSYRKKGGKGPGVSVRTIAKERIEALARAHVIQDGTKVLGTMHEKFILFYPDPKSPPTHVFNGSANLSNSSEFVYAENRFFFPENLELSALFHNEFTRLWNEFSVPRINGETKLEYIPVPETSRIDVMFNSENSFRGPDNQIRIDNAIIHLLETVTPVGGTIDVAIFSFTHWGIAEKILELAGRYPGIAVRILLDQSMLPVEGSDRPYVASFRLEQERLKRGLKNLDIRYKWRANSYGWDEEKKVLDLVHLRSFLLHHKIIVVDRSRMVTGSYNFSQAAEFYNLENAMFFDGQHPGHLEPVQRFMLEFEKVWNNFDSGAVDQCYFDFSRLQAYPDSLPKVTSYEIGREWRVRVITALADKKVRALRDLIEKGHGPKSADKGLDLAELGKFSGEDKNQIQRGLAKLERARLVVGIKSGTGPRRYFSRD